MSTNNLLHLRRVQQKTTFISIIYFNAFISLFLFTKTILLKSVGFCRDKFAQVASNVVFYSFEKQASAHVSVLHAKANVCPCGAHMKLANTDFPIAHAALILI